MSELKPRSCLLPTSPLVQTTGCTWPWTELTTCVACLPLAILITVVAAIIIAVLVISLFFAVSITTLVLGGIGRANHKTYVHSVRGKQTTAHVRLN